ncbi:MAG: MmgE/PrpD family protein, partial [Pseudomonadota bacterium]
TLNNGNIVEERQAQLRGGVKEPMSRTDILAKARANLIFAGWQPDALDILLDLATTLFDSDASFSARPLAMLGT